MRVKEMPFQSMPSSFSTSLQDTARAVLDVTDIEAISIESHVTKKKNAHPNAKKKDDKDHVFDDICKIYLFQGFMYYLWHCLHDEGTLNMVKGGGKGGRRTRNTQVLSLSVQLAHLRENKEEIGAKLGQLRETFEGMLGANEESSSATDVTPAKSNTTRSARQVDPSVKLHLRLSALFADWTNVQAAEIGDKVADYMASLFKDQLREHQALYYLLTCYIVVASVNVDSNFGLVYRLVPKNEIAPGETHEDVDPAKCKALKVFLDVPGQGHSEIKGEIHLMKVTSGSPFSVDVTLTSDNKRVPFVLMEWMSGGSLSERIEKVPAHDRLKDAPHLTMTLCSGLIMLNVRNVGHRDIKPDNVMLRDSSVASSKFFDFGLAVEKATGTLRAGTFCGTDRYISPELECGEEKDLQYHAPCADVHSTGMTVLAYIIGIKTFDKLVSRTPIDTSTGEKFKASELVATLKAHGVSASGIDLLSRMTDPNPITRISAVGAMGHRWLKDAKCVNPYLQEGAEEHRWVFYQADRLENLQEKVTVLEETSASADQKLDRANKQASEANKHVAELQTTNVELEKTISALKNQLDQALSKATAKKTEIKGASHLPGANLDLEAATCSMSGGSDEVLFLATMIGKGPTPLDCAAFIDYDTFHDDVERYGDLLVFGLLFESRWEEQRSKPGRVTLEAFLGTYGHSLGKVTLFLKDNAPNGKKYYGGKGYTKRSLDDKTDEGKKDEGARKQRWKANAAKVAADVHSKCVKGGIDSVKTFSSARGVIGPIVNAVFNETAGFEVVTESCRRSFAAALAAIHVGATSADSEA